MVNNHGDRKSPKIIYIYIRIHKCIDIQRKESWYRWWLKPGEHQLRLVVYPVIYKSLYIPGGAGFPCACLPCDMMMVSYDDNVYQYAIQIYYHIYVCVYTYNTCSKHLHMDIYIYIDPKKHVYHLESRWLATPIGLGLSWPLTKNPPLGVASHLLSLWCTYCWWKKSCTT